MHRNMNIPPFLKATFFIIVLLNDFLTSGSESPYTPTDNILLNCGSFAGDLDDDGRKWIGEDDNSSVLIEASNSNIKSINGTALRQGSGVTQIPFMTARISRSAFTYTFAVSPGQKFIRLYFYPTSYPDFMSYKEFFDVKAGSYTLLTNFSASFAASVWEVETIFFEFCVNVKENERHFNVSFIPLFGDSNSSCALINGIEIVSMPTNLYYTPSDSTGLLHVGHSDKYFVQNNTALFTFLRLNVGGKSIKSTADTGMFRSWAVDDLYVDYLAGNDISRSLSFAPNYSKVPAYSAPDDLYRCGRSFRARNSTRNLMKNLTWSVPVDHGFDYLVRLHFCEFDEFIKKANERRFIVIIDNQVVDPGFDIIESSGGVRTPIYKDYIVTVGNTGVGDYKVNITLHPNESSIYKDALLNGIEVYKLSDSSGIINMSNPNLMSPPPESQLPTPPPQPKARTKLIIAVCGSLLGLFLVLLVTFFLFVFQVKKRKKFNSYHQSLAYCLCLRKGDSLSSTRDSLLPDKRCRYFSLDEIKAATNDFEKLIGVGGFGNVYRGEIDDGARPVAIKRLNPMSKQGAGEFNTEIEMLSQLRHAHLVSLTGYCNEDDEKILVYEYMENGTLQEHLYETDKDPLPWKRRLEICIGVASGLNYLHTGATQPIIHRDVKTTNILLDEKWVAKVSDFGLSKIGLSNSAVSTFVKGTIGYLDPEYARCKQLTEKSDVYSLGVVLLEVLCARKVVDNKLDQEQRSLVLWARKCIENGTVHQIIDPYLMGKIAPECFNKFVEVAENCVRQQGSERPTMQDVMENLEFALKLQNDADTKTKKMNPNDEVAYPEVSFCAPTNRSIIEGSETESDESDQISSDMVQFTTKSLGSSTTTTTSSNFIYNSSSTSTA